MKTAYPCLAGLCALALAVVAIPAPGNELPARDLDSPHAHTAIGAVLDANGGNVPATGLQLAAALAKLGDFVQLPVAFSAVAPNSGIANPRVVLTVRPSSHSVRDNRGVVGSQWGGSQRPTADPLIKSQRANGLKPNNRIPVTHHWCCQPNGNSSPVMRKRPNPDLALTHERPPFSQSG